MNALTLNEPIRKMCWEMFFNVIESAESEVKYEAIVKFTSCDHCVAFCIPNFADSINVDNAESAFVQSSPLEFPTECFHLSVRFSLERFLRKRDGTWKGVIEGTQLGADWSCENPESCVQDYYKFMEKASAYARPVSEKIWIWPFKYSGWKCSSHHAIDDGKQTQGCHC